MTYADFLGTCLAKPCRKCNSFEWDGLFNAEKEFISEGYNLILNIVVLRFMALHSFVASEAVISCVVKIHKTAITRVCGSSCANNKLLK